LNRVLIESFVRNNIEFSFSHSSGSGGQNVNKLNTKVQAKLALSKITFFTDEELNRIRIYLKNRINRKDEIILQVQQERKQNINKEIAINRIINLLINSLKRKKKRIKTRPSKSSIERRLKFKKLRSIRKKQRSETG
jgi:ribosome-associated protein